MLEFELHRLGWYAFEQLCRTICREVWRQPVEAYSRGPDGARDGALYGQWHTGTHASPAILQCKHTSISGSHLTLSDVAQELPKVERHVAAGRCDVYVLMTNAKVSGGASAEIEAAFRDVGVSRAMIFGYESICEMLTEHKALRVLVPRLYGLGDLTEILDDRAYEQAEAILATMHDEIARLVPVEAHHAAHRALRNHRFALLLGRPGSGKSSIAASLAIGAIDLYEARPIRLTRIQELPERWNPREPNQFFWLDDGFGATQYEYANADAWNRTAHHINAAIDRSARFIVTSRDYIYAAAQHDLKISAFPLLDEASVVIDVESFTNQEREQILYNHLKLGRQEPAVLRAMRSADLEAVAHDSSFLPELARRLSDPLFTRDVLVENRDSLLSFFRSPAEYLLEVLRTLDPPSRAALGLVHLRGGRLPSPYMSARGDDHFLNRVGVRLGDALGALVFLDGSLLRLVSVGGSRWWQFRHPTFADAYQLWLAADPELIAEYVTSATFEELVATITCGNVGLEGALIVPSSLYEAVLGRLLSSRPPTGWEGIYQWRRSLITFLALRCDASLLRLFVRRSPEMVEDVFNIGLYVSAFEPQRRLARVLLDLGLADESYRVKLVEKLIDYAAYGLDGSFLADEEWLSFFQPEELDELDGRVSEGLYLLRDQVDDDLRASEGSVSSIDESVAGYEARYFGNTHVVAARRLIDNYEHYEPDGDVDSWREEATREGLPEPQIQGRSIFDDLLG